MYSNTLVKGVSCSIQFLVPMKSREGKHKTLNKCAIKIMLITLVTHFGKMLPFLSWNKSYSIKGPSFKPWRSIETPCPTPQQTCTKVLHLEPWISVFGEPSLLVTTMYWYVLYLCLPYFTVLHYVLHVLK